MLIAETEYRNEVEVVTAPFRGLALGVFLITIGMRIDLGAILADWTSLFAALAGVIIVKVDGDGIASPSGRRRTARRCG